MKKIIGLFLILIAFDNVISQTANNTISGTIYGVTGNTKETLEGAVVKWIHTRIGTVTEIGGKFQLDGDKITDRRLIVMYVGFKTDTVDIGEKSNVEVSLINTMTTKTITVESNMNSSFIQNKNLKTEVITEAELKKSACCDLSGCFGKNASVDVTVTDILTNTKEFYI